MNSFIIYSLHTGKEMDRDRFVMEVLKSLCSSNDEPPAAVPRPLAPAPVSKARRSITATSAASHNKEGNHFTGVQPAELGVMNA